MSEKKAVNDIDEVLTDLREKTLRQEVPSWIAEHLDQYEASPEKGHLWDARPFGGHERTPTLLLTTRGRRSGRLVTMPLIYGQDGDRYVIVGSKGGAPEHPAWYLNLQAEPEVDVQVAGDRFHATARTATGEERARLFEMMASVYPPYPSYQARTPREIPVVVLERKA